MRDLLAKLTPESWLARKILMAAVLIGACVTAFCWGRKQNVNAQPSNPFGELAKPGSPDYNRRVVAYLGQNTPITREELGEYLIARFGAERLEFLVNRKIVEMECQKYRISVTDAEVEERFRRDLNSFGKLPLTPRDFEQNVLRRFNKTMYEWKEDVIRPKIMMEKLVKEHVKVSEQDVRDGFEARFGPKVEVRMIVLEKGNIGLVQDVWGKVRQSPEQFLKEAKQQFIPNLATDGGKVPPIHKHFGDKLIEDTAFRLKPGEISEPLKMQDGTYVILMCERHLPADITAKYDFVRMQIHKEVEELKIAQKIPEVFNELRKNASPRLVLENAVHHMARADTPQPVAPLSAFDQRPQGPPPVPMNVPAPTPSKVLAPEGSPSLLPSAPPQPLNTLPQLPNLSPPVDKK